MSYNFIYSGFSDEIDENIDVQFKTLNKLGIKFFEVRGVNGKNISELDDTELKILKDNMENYGIRVSSIGSPIGKISITDDFDAHFELFKRVVFIAKYLESKYIRMFSFYCPEDKNPDDYKEEVFKRINRMVKYAEENDVVLLHENEKGIYGDTAVRCREIFKNINSANLKAVFDPANFVQCGQTVYPDAYEILKDNIEYIHIKDSDLNGNVVPAGHGEGCISQIIKELKEKNYNGFLSLEPHLGVFSGLENLELDDKMTKLEKSSSEKFEYAFQELKKLI